MTNNINLNNKSTLHFNAETDSNEYKDLLIEIGCEELPPKALKNLSDAFVQAIYDELNLMGINFGKCYEYCTPRRLALHIEAVSTKQPDRIIEKKGPPVAASMKDGIPSAALIGFAKSCNVPLEALEIQETDKGSWYIFNQTILGKNSSDIIPLIVEKALNQLPIPKKMRWANHDFSFVRPMRWLVIMLGKDIVPAKIFGIDSGQTTYAHRFHQSDASSGDTSKALFKNGLHINSPKDYQHLLSTQGHVIPNFNDRQNMILEQTKLAVSNATNGRCNAVISPELLNEVTALVEWPVALIGKFESRFLDVPQEALISTMQDNQKYFPIVDSEGRLQPQFCFIANLESKNPQAVIEGNERVIRPRFSDAEFFWNTDKKGRLEDHLIKLESVIFQTKLGSQADKTRRVSQLAQTIASQIGADSAQTRRAAQLAKCDLLTNMVQEFPELQGIMGKYYANQQSESIVVANALEQIYWPRFSGDQLPQSLEAQALAIAERMDTLVGIFSISQIPTGSKDPFSLRRAALGVLRILIECKLDLDLKLLVIASAHTMPHAVNASHVVESVLNYILERMKAYCTDLGIPADTYQSIANLSLTRPVDIFKRLSAVSEFRKLKQSTALSTANKRIRTILRKNMAASAVDKTEDNTQSFLNPHLQDISQFNINKNYLIENQEKKLFETALQIHQDLNTLCSQQNYHHALTLLSKLSEPLDSFFEEVMVMCENPTVSQNRLNLLTMIESMFLQLADISVLQSTAP